MRMHSSRMQHGNTLRRRCNVRRPGGQPARRGCAPPAAAPQRHPAGAAGRRRARQSRCALPPGSPAQTRSGLHARQQGALLQVVGRQAGREAAAWAAAAACYGTPSVAPVIILTLCVLFRQDGLRQQQARRGRGKVTRHRDGRLRGNRRPAADDFARPKSESS